jgi:DinB superfamily
MTGTPSGGAMTAIEIPDATTEPAAYVCALLDTLGDHDPLEVYETTAGQVRQLCQNLSATQWRVPLGAGEWNAAQIVGHLIDVDIVYGFRFRLVLTEEESAYPGYQEKLWSQLPRPGPTELVSVLAGLRAYNTALLRRTPHDRWQRRGTHGEQGREQFGLMVTKVAGHDLAHLNQLARTIVVATGVDAVPPHAETKDECP